MVFIKKLPKLYKNDYIETINHNKNSCYVNKNNIDKVVDVINSIFKGFGHPYNTKVLIETKDRVIETYLISRNKNDIITLDNEIISLNDIVSIRIKN